MSNTTITTHPRESSSTSSRSIGAPPAHRRVDTFMVGRLASIAGFLLAAAVVYWPASQALAALWDDTEARTYTHGYLVLAVSVWLVFDARDDLAAARAKPIPIALGPLVLLSALWVVFWKAGLQDLQLIVLPPMILTALVAALGWAVGRRLAFPILFLYFALPLWGQVNGLLQSATVKAVGALIWATGLPAIITGNFVTVPSGTFEIADGCSGLHFLIAGAAIAALHGELFREPLSRRLRWVALMGALALAANWIRVFVIIVAGYLTQMQTFLVTVDHYWFGWAVFACAMGLFFWLATRTRWAEQGVQPHVIREDGGVATTVQRPHTSVPAQAYAGALVCLCAVPILVYALGLARPADASPIRVVWPPAPERWTQVTPAHASSWTPWFHGASIADRRGYSGPGGYNVEVFTATYRTQRQGVELVAYDNSVLGDPASHQALEAHDVRVSGRAWRELLTVGEAGEEAVIWSRYHIGERVFRSGFLSQLWYGVASIGASPLSSVIALRSACEPDCEAARARLQAFVEGSRNLPHPVVTALGKSQ
jgi:exosortase A